MKSLLPAKVFERAGTICPSEMDMAYAAGFFDGEGNITIGINRRAGKRRLTTTYSMRIGVAQNELAPLLWLKERWAGSIHAQKRKTAASNVTHVWTCCTRQAAIFLSDVYPHLRVKKERARLAIEFQATRVNCGARGHSDEYRVAQIEF